MKLIASRYSSLDYYVLYLYDNFHVDGKYVLVSHQGSYANAFYAYIKSNLSRISLHLFNVKLLADDIETKLNHGKLIYLKTIST